MLLRPPAVAPPPNVAESTWAAPRRPRLTLRAPGRPWCCTALRCAALCCAVLCCAVLCCAVLCCAVLCCAMRRPWPSGGAHPVRRARVLTGGPQLDECLAVLRGEEAIDLEHRRIGMHQPEALVLRVHLRRHATRLAFFNRSRRAQAARGTAGMPLRDRPQQDELFVPSADVTSRGVDQARTAIWRDMSAFTPLPLASPACFFQRLCCRDLDASNVEK